MAKISNSILYRLHPVTVRRLWRLSFSDQFRQKADCFEELGYCLDRFLDRHK